MTPQQRCMDAFRDSKRVDRHGEPVDRQGRTLKALPIVVGHDPETRVPEPADPIEPGFIPDEDETQSAYPPAELPAEPVSVRYQVNSHIAERLQRKFGLGTNPDRRRRLYASLAEEVERHPEAERVIGDCVQCAFGKDAAGEPIKNPGNWFCRSVILRLREAGFLRTTDW